MDAVNYKCPACSAPLTFRPDTQLFTCDYCESVYTLQALEEMGAGINAEQQENINMDWNGPEDDEWRGSEADDLLIYNCPSCGAELFADKTTGASSCIYCGNTTIMPQQFAGVLRPQYIIPFQVTKEQAKQAFLNNCKGKKLLPKSFTSQGTLEKITGLYVPFWLYDCEIDADMEYKGTKTSFWSDANYNYTKTDYYGIKRQGSMDFDLVPVDGSKMMEDSYMDAIEPYDYSGLVEFNMAYLSGFIGDKYDVTMEESQPRANTRIQTSVIDAFRQTVSGYESVTPSSTNINLNQGGAHYALLPVWLLNSKYNGKTYTFAMNGQTGKFIGELPYSKGRAWGWFLGLSAAFCALGLIIAKLFV